ncbi:MAG: NAD-dependent epimerase/dehydratase family protein [Micropepsaceae bacterium]
MTNRIAVLGANGVYARHLMPRLIAAGYRVRALVRRPEAANAARACGAEVATADIFDTASLTAALAGCDVGVNLATSLPGPSGRGSFEANDRLRSEGTANWIAACAEAGVKRVVQQSIGMVNARGAEWADEDSVADAADDSVAAKAIRAALVMEQHVAASALDWVILRGGLFYGPGTGFDDAWYAAAAAGKLRLPGDGSDFVSLVHIADMAAATVAVLKRWPSRTRLIVCDDQPSQWRDVFGTVAALAGQGALEEGGRAGFPSFRLKNTRAREALAWAPTYASYREGLVR